MFRTAVASALLAAAALVPGHGSAAPDNVPAQSTAYQETNPFADRQALDACIDATELEQRPGIDPSTIDARLRKPDNRIQGLDLSGQELSGQDFRGKVLIDVKFKGARLRGVDLTEAIICRSDLTNADLTGVRLDRALIGGDSELQGANFSNASARAVKIGNASGMIRIDGADLRGAIVACEPDESPRCMGRGVGFASMAGADLRGATVSHLCCSSAGLATARLDGVTTHLNGYVDMDFAQLAAGVGANGRITLLPDNGYSGRRTQFSGAELRRLAAIVKELQSASARPSFDCARAATKVEKSICADPRLAALDRALNWLWARLERTPLRKAEQRKWLDSRSSCPPPGQSSSDPDILMHPFVSPADPRGCIALAYAQRIRQLAPDVPATAVTSGTFTTDPPFDLPKGTNARLAEKFFIARGFREDEITLKDVGNGAGKITGSGVWANGHSCGFEATEAETKRVGSRFQIFEDPARPNDEYSISFAITPDVAVRVGGAKQFQCGARGGWSDIYFRQPPGLIAKRVKRFGQ